ncbi:MAG: hypothetical protein WBP76_04525 [Leptotrichiaceae bacterium]|jgi:hypothetical protein|nr:hypothetical protein [Leptotrichiaceae bacterium]MBP7025755.1 hypothetical protein [Leptotrichiaceae bacterium]MBP8637224.1 hypothetical protein [Leptotrichiaceae bacterium]MBP9539087.1 hypothetical protein [Leptotrichiaceae bacterium]
MDYLYEDDEIICKINNFEMLSDKNIKKISKDRRVLLYSSKSGKMFKVLVFILMFIYFIIISSKLTINESNLFKLLYFILSITFPIFLICFRKYLFENNLLIININSIILKYTNSKKSNRLSKCDVYFFKDKMRFSRTTGDIISSINYSELYQLFKLNEGYYFKLSRSLFYYFPLDEFSNESIANLDVIFIKYGMITKNY